MDFRPLLKGYVQTMLKSDLVDAKESLRSHAALQSQMRKVGRLIEIQGWL
jgi:hypothetical protein